MIARALVAATILFHLATSHGYGYFRDELYYLACSDRLAAGYVDHPPLLEWLLRPLRAVLGDSLPALRLLPALAAGATMLLTAAMVGALGGGRRALVAAALPVMVAPIFLGTFGILTPNAFDVVAWCGALLLMVRLLGGDDDRVWPWIGAVVGLGFLTKHGMAFLVIGLAAGVLATGARRHLRSRRMWVGIAIASVLAAPHLLWQAAHGWPVLEFMANARRLKNLAQSPLAFLVEQVMVLNPVAAPIWLAGLVSLWRRDDGRYRAIAVAYVAILAVMIAGTGKAYYLAPFYPVLFAAGAVALERTTRPGWLVTALPVLVLVTGAALAPLAKPLLREDRFVRYAAALGMDPRLGVGERHELGLLPQHLADQHGWPELAAAVAEVYHALPAAERERACIFAGNYGEAAAIDFFGPAHGLPRALSGHNSYWLWGPDGCDFSVVVAVGVAPADVRALVGSVEIARQFVCPYCMPFENGPILVTRGLTVPVPELWGRVKRYL